MCRGPGDSRIDERVARLVDPEADARVVVGWIWGLERAAALPVVRVSSSLVRAWICRCPAARFTSLRVSFMIVLSCSVTAWCACARRCGVVGRSWVLVTFAPPRTLLMSVS